jgi:hypothetical protein
MHSFRNPKRRFFCMKRLLKMMWEITREEDGTAMACYMTNRRKEGGTSS